MIQQYIVYTLVDITDNNSKSKNVIAYNQKQNFNTLIQLAGMRSQPISIAVKCLEAQDVVDYRFGSAHKGLHHVWKIEFAVEHADVYMLNDNPVHFLENDFDGVAFTPYLTETANFVTNTVETYDEKLLNIYFKKT